MDVRYVRLYTILAWLRVHCVINAFGYQILPIFGHLQLKLNSLHVYIYIFYKWHIVTYTWSLGLVDSRLVKKNKKWINIILIIFVMRFGLTVSYLFFEIYINCTCISYRIRRCLCCRPLFDIPFDETLAGIYVIVQQKHAVFFILRQWYYWISIEANFGTDKIMFRRIWILQLYECKWNKMFTRITLILLYIL